MLPKKTNFKTSKNVCHLKCGAYRKINENKYRITTDGETVTTTKSIYEYCKSEKVSLVKSRSKDDVNLMNYYKEYKKNFEDFERKSGISFARGKYKIRDTAFYIWNLVRDQNFKFGESTIEEQDMIFQANRSGLRYKKKGVYKNMIELDINKQYSSILSSSNHSLPKGTPVKKIITQQQIDRYYKFPFGLYHCKIYGDLKGHLFMENKNNVYTHIEMQLAKELGFKIKLIKDEYLHYKEKFKACKLFGAYINLLMPHSKGNSSVKNLMNIIHGLFCKKNKKYVKTKDEKGYIPEFQIKTTKQVLDVDGVTLKEIETYETRIFKYNACRIGPFITAIGRCQMTRALQNHRKNVVYIHTDGFIAKKTKQLLIDFPHSKQIGKFKHVKHHLLKEI